MTEQLKEFWGGCLILLCGIIAVSVVLKAIHEDTRSVSSTVEGRGPTLEVTALQEVLVAVDEKSLDEVTAALMKRDQPRINDLVDAGVVYKVKNGTKVRILERRLGQSLVRVLEGENAMKQGWVPERWIKE